MYDAALKESSRKTYKTGQRAYIRFIEEAQLDGAILPFIPRSLSRTELCLSFFIAYLVTRPSIASASTILGYEGHVKYLFRSQGCDPSVYNTAFLRQLRRGVENIFPKQEDRRIAFFLPHFLQRRTFRMSAGKKGILEKLATVLGFMGMLRPHTFNQLKPSSFVFVKKDRSVTTPTNSQKSFRKMVHSLPANKDMLGFYITFKSKTMPHARAYFPNIATTCQHYAPLCPLKALRDVAEKG